MRKSMFAVVFITLLMVLVFYLNGQNNDDINACEYARGASNPTTWKFYLQNFPNGICVDEAKRALKEANRASEQATKQEDLNACATARNKNSFDGWSKYLTQYPQGECNFEAKTMRKKLAMELVGTKWSKASFDRMKWDKARSYCRNLREGGYSDWRLPTISELRTLIQDCPATETGGACRVNDNCLDNGNCWNYSCSGCSSNGTYSIFGDTGRYNSASTISGSSSPSWYVDFDDASIYNNSGKYGGKKSYGGRRVRCIRGN